MTESVGVKLFGSRFARIYSWGRLSSLLRVRGEAVFFLLA